MPTYEYRCPQGHDFERFYKTMSAAASELECPECGATATRRLSGGAGFMFKGSGFYLTDYGKNAHRGGAPAKADGSKSESPKSDASTPDASKAGPSKAEAPKPESPKPKASKPKSE
jgi:putative FmdB family regulatory protein